MREAVGHGCRGGGSREKTSTLAYSGATPCKYEWLLWRWHAQLCFLAVYWERAWDFSRTWVRKESFCRRPCRGLRPRAPDLSRSSVSWPRAWQESGQHQSEDMWAWKHRKKKTFPLKWATYWGLLVCNTTSDPWINNKACETDNESVCTGQAQVICFRMSIKEECTTWHIWRFCSCNAIEFGLKQRICSIDQWSFWT